MTYNDITRRCFEAPRCAGTADGPGWLRGAAGSPDRGTWVQFDVEVPPGEFVIRAVRFLAFGCPHVIAVAQWVAEQAVGRAAAAGLPDGVAALRQRFAVPTEKLGRLLVLEDAWAAALRTAAPGGAAASE